MQSVILEVVVHDTLAEAVVLVGVFNYGFLEIGIKFKDLKIWRSGYFPTAGFELNLPVCRV